MKIYIILFLAILNVAQFSYWFYVRKIDREKYIKQGIKHVYTELGMKSNLIQYRKVKYLITELLNDIQRGRK